MSLTTAKEAKSSYQSPYRYGNGKRPSSAKKEEYFACRSTSPYSVDLRLHGSHELLEGSAAKRRLES